MTPFTSPPGVTRVPATGTLNVNGSVCCPASRFASMTRKKGHFVMLHSPTVYSFHVPLRTSTRSTPGEPLFMIPLKIGYPPTEAPSSATRAASRR